MLLWHDDDTRDGRRSPKKCIYEKSGFVLGHFVWQPSGMVHQVYLMRGKHHP